MTDQYSPAPRKPGRPSNAEVAARTAPAEPVVTEPANGRAEEVAVRRRRREGLGPERNLKLHIPTELKDPNYEHRWVNDRPGRVQQLTQQDDWEPVPGMEGVGLGKSVTERAVDAYTGEKAVLLRKRKEWYDEDKKAEQKALDERDEAMRRGPLPAPEGAGGGEADKVYTPGGRNVIAGR